MNTTEMPATDTPTPVRRLAGHNAPSGCCGGPAPAGTDACCDHDAKGNPAGGTGCGCAEAAAPPTASLRCC